MALLSFPPSPNNNDYYPVIPAVGQQQYQWSSAESTWRLVGTSTGVSAGTYGDGTNVGQFTVDAVGRITFAQNVPIASGAGGTVTQVDTGTGLTGGPITASGTVSLDTAYTDTLYLGLSGGTLTGDVTFSGTQAFPGVLPLTGGTLTGDITFSGTQTFPNTPVIVTAPTASTDPGSPGEIAFGPGEFFFFDGTQWLKVTGAVF